MKKLKIFLVFSLIAMLLVPLHINAMTAVGNINVAYGTANIDGNINADEWSAAEMFTISSANAKPWSGDIAADFKADIYTLWDDSGIYFAGKITDSTFKSSDAGGYGGDAFQISIDLGQVFYGTDNSRAVFYSFGCYDDTALVQVQEATNSRIINDGDEGVAIKTNSTASGWEFELFFPWTVLQNDMNEKISKDVTVGVGLKINALMCYLDRSASGDLIAALGTTVNDESVDFDWIPDEHGVTFVLNELVIPEVIVEAAPVEDTAAAPVTQVAASATASAPQTSDALSIVILMAIVSGAGLITQNTKNKK